MAGHEQLPFIGRGAQAAPPNRFEAVRAEDDFEQLAEQDDALATGRKVATQFLPDRSKTIIAENDSPDIGFRYSINAYRGCEHGCAYCYARPTHEYLGMNAGLDFEAKVLVKHEAPQLLRDALSRASWRGETIMMSGVTDCYQPAERQLRLTRGLLEVMREAKQCVGIITKNALVLRDLDILADMARERLVHVHLSVTTLDATLARTLEPRTSPPAARIEAIRQLVAAGVPTGVMVAPVIPGLTDHEMPHILAAASSAGARSAGYVLLRLPHAVRELFFDWMSLHRPDAAARVESRIRSTREGALYDHQFGSRQRGSGQYAEQIANNFRVFQHKFGLDAGLLPLDTSRFRTVGGQLNLF